MVLIFCLDWTAAALMRKTPKRLAASIWFKSLNHNEASQDDNSCNDTAFL